MKLESAAETLLLQQHIAIGLPSKILLKQMLEGKVLAPSTGVSPGFDECERFVLMAFILYNTRH